MCYPSPIVGKGGVEVDRNDVKGRSCGVPILVGSWQQGEVAGRRKAVGGWWRRSS